jgi:hypothetical protein
MKRLKLFINYLKNNRVSQYENIIKRALEREYEVISLRDYIEERYDKKRKLLVLRHDVDNRSLGEKKIFEVEQRYGVKSSFYFRNSTFNPTFMREIESYGSEASLHFEPIADFVKANDIKTRDKLYAISNWQERCLELLNCNIQRFRNLLNIPCVTIASHGEYENGLVQTPNNYLTEDISVYKFLNIKLEAYNKNMLESVTCYISDVPIEMNGGYRYGTTPFQAIERGEEFIMFLSHPCHWHYNRWNQFKKLVKVIIKKPIEKRERFIRV